MTLEQYTENHLNIICKNITVDFLIFQKEDKKIYFEFNVIENNPRLSDITAFIANIDLEHAKMYILDIFHHGFYSHSYRRVGGSLFTDDYTEQRISDILCAKEDMKSVLRKGEYIHVVANNNGWYGII